MSMMTIGRMRGLDILIAPLPLTTAPPRPLGPTPVIDGFQCAPESWLTSPLVKSPMPWLVGPCETPVLTLTQPTVQSTALHTFDSAAMPMPCGLQCSIFHL